MSNQIDIKNAKCTGLSLMAPVQFGKDEKKDADFIIEAYTGEVVDRWWGLLAIDIDGIKAKKKIPIFRGHNQDMVVGFSKNTWKDGSFFVSGKFSGVTEHAKEARALADEGFPWQASIGVRPLKIMSIEDGATHEVNGKKLKGPAEVWLEAEVFETSFVPLGADDKTSVSVFSKFEEVEQPKEAGDPANKKEERMGEKEKTPAVITIESLGAENPEVFKAVLDQGKTEGAKVERERIKSVSEQLMSGHEDLITGLMYDGKTTGPEAAVAVLQAEKKIRGQVIDGLKKDSIQPVNAATPPDVETLVIDDSLPVEEQAKLEWDKEKGLKAEFGNDFDAYLAYRKATANGSVKLLKNKKEDK